MKIIMLKKKTIIEILMIFIIIGIVFSAYIIANNQKNKEGIENILKDIENVSANLTEYVVYGTHLNIKGEIRDNIENIQELNLIIASIAGKEEKITLNYEKEGSITYFSTSNLINEGIDLEKIDIDKYIILIEAEYGSRTKRYSIKNLTSYDNIIYYTITRNNKNNKINITFDTYKLEGKSVNYMSMEVKQAKLPKDVYDIVIDPGHGGSDTGAKANGYEEADLTLEYGKKIKAELEKLGLKVKITRDGTEDEESFGAQTVYDEDGRVNIVGDSKAKYVFSIHLNSITEPNSLSGVEVYAPPKMNLSLARAFANNIVKYANTTYSDLGATYKQYDGVYVRTFKDWEIEESRQEAENASYEPYDITEETPYLYMLRETGGIATGAYVDGRNTSYGTNKYYNSNIGVEAYLLELRLYQ